MAGRVTRGVAQPAPRARRIWVAPSNRASCFSSQPISLHLAIRLLRTSFRAQGAFGGCKLVDSLLDRANAPKIEARCAHYVYEKIARRK